MLSQGHEVKDVECLLNLMRNLRVVTLEGVTISIPLVFAEEWLLQEDMHDHWIVKQKDYATMFARSGKNQLDLDYASGEIHQKLVRSVNEYLNENKRHGILLDVVQRPRSSGSKYLSGTGFLVSENRGAYYLGATHKDVHPLFRQISDQVPKLLLETQALIRLTFPLSIPAGSAPPKMGTIIIGVKLLLPDLKVFSAKEELSDSTMEQVRYMVEFLATEITNQYSQLMEDYKRNPPRTRPKAVKTERKDEIHSAIDLLHSQIARLATRLGMKEWASLEIPSAGYNFLIAFRELDKETLKGHLRYYLTSHNREALRASLSSDKWLNSRRYKQFQATLTHLFSRKYGENAQAMAEAFVKRCRTQVEKILSESKSPEWTAQRFARLIESSTYPLHLTPGYHVMELGYPEVIKNWLADPRATDFSKYPPFLLDWESRALPESGEIYYSPIADGSIHFGICGVKAELLYRGGGFELQQLIDESASRLRNTICNKLIAELKDDLFDARKNGTSGLKLWGDYALWHFRQLAYYYLPGRHDYFTKLVSDDDLASISNDGTRSKERWEKGETVQWWSLKGKLTERTQSKLQAIPHCLPSEVDHLGKYLGKPGGLTDARLYRVQLTGAHGWSLLVLVPSPHHHYRAAGLLRRFTTACEAALTSYNDESRLVLNASEFGHQFVYLLPLMDRGLMNVTGGPFEAMRLLTEVLQNEVDYFTGQIPNIILGSHITLGDLINLLSDIHKMLQWVIEATDEDDVQGHMEGITAENVRLFGDAIKLMRRRKNFENLAGQCLGIPRSAALFLMWEVIINLCRHTKSRIKFSIAQNGSSTIKFDIESNRTIEERTGRHGIDRVQSAAELIGVGIVCGPDMAHHLVYRTSITFVRGGFSTS